MAEIFDNGSKTGTANTTVSVVTGSEIVEYDCSVFTFVVYVVVFGTIVVFGLVGNGVSWVVLAWDRRDRGRVASFLLRTMAVADNLFLVAAGLAQISSALIFYLDSLEYQATVDVPVENLTTPANVSVDCASPNSSDYCHAAGTGDRSLYDDVSAYVTTYVTVCVFPLVHVTQMWTVWITVLVALSRYVAICHPYQAPRLCTMRRVRQQVAFVALAVLVYNAPRFMEFNITHVREQVNSSVYFISKFPNSSQNRTFQHYLSFFMRSIIR